MSRKRTTVDVSTIVMTANRMIAHLAKSGTKSDADKREAIIAVTSQILLDANVYCGFRYLNPPTAPMKGEIGLQYDDTRIEFYGMGGGGGKPIPAWLKANMEAANA